MRGFWKIIAMFLPRRSRRDFSPIDRTSTPLYRMLPELILPGGFMSFKMERPRVDFPQPDSPTMPRTSPFRTESETSSTAQTVPIEMG